MVKQWCKLFKANEYIKEILDVQLYIFFSYSTFIYLEKLEDQNRVIWRPITLPNVNILL